MVLVGHHLPHLILVDVFKLCLITLLMPSWTPSPWANHYFPPDCRHCPSASPLPFLITSMVGVSWCQQHQGGDYAAMRPPLQSSVTLNTKHCTIFQSCNVVWLTLLLLIWTMCTMSLCVASIVAASNSCHIQQELFSYSTLNLHNILLHSDRRVHNVFLHYFVPPTLHQCSR